MLQQLPRELLLLELPQVATMRTPQIRRLLPQPLPLLLLVLTECLVKQEINDFMSQSLVLFGLVNISLCLLMDSR